MDSTSKEKSDLNKKSTEVKEETADPKIAVNFSESEFDKKIRAGRDKVRGELALGEKLSIINLIDGIIEHAYAIRASDIHLDPAPEEMSVRLRIDGILQDVHSLPKSISSEVTTRIKILSGLRTDEHQAAQDGRFTVIVEDGSSIDMRVSIIPTYYGENIVLRLLVDQAEEYTLEALGFSKDNAKKIMQAVKRPYGMILATGPTGSGKTTTLYTILKQINRRDVSIVTIEDPIEYAIPGIEQIQVNNRSGLTFANGLRSILRQDPNVIMVGEIRDSETAGIAVNTALTGHLVLSTLHTNDAATTLPRLLDMKIEPYLIASTVNIAIGQRLVRKICVHCKKQFHMSQIERDSLKNSLKGVDSSFFADDTPTYKGTGCEKCNNTGYFGRIGIHEVLVPDGAIRDAVLSKAPASEIRLLAIKQGMITIVEDGLAKVKAGLTTPEEILRMFYE